MTTYYKAVRPDGTSFRDPTFRWAPQSGPVEGSWSSTQARPAWSSTGGTHERQDGCDC